MAFALGLAVAAGPAAAMDVLECTFADNGSNMGYLPLIVIVAHEAGKDVATIVDPFIQSEKGGPIEVKVAADNDAKLAVSWQIMLKSKTNDYVNMHYRLSIQKGSLKASLAGKPQGYQNTFTAQGKCKRKTG